MILFSIFVRHLRKKKANHSDFFFLADTNTTDILIPKGVGFIWDCSHQGNFQQTFGCQRTCGIKEIKRTFQAIITAITQTYLSYKDENIITTIMLK